MNVSVCVHVYVCSVCMSLSAILPACPPVRLLGQLPPCLPARPAPLPACVTLCRAVLCLLQVWSLLLLLVGAFVVSCVETLAQSYQAERDERHALLLEQQQQQQRGRGSKKLS